MIMSDSPPPRCIEGRVVADMDRRVIVRRPSKLPSSPVVAEASRSKLVSVRDGDETPASHSCAGGGPRGVLPGAPRRIRADMARRGGVGVGAAGATRAVVPESKWTTESNRTFRSPRPRGVRADPGAGVMLFYYYVFFFFLISGGRVDSILNGWENKKNKIKMQFNFFFKNKNNSIHHGTLSTAWPEWWRSWPCFSPLPL
jgi:hypothetical protein